MMLNGLYVLAWCALITAACHFIPKAFAHDELMLTLRDLDDEELAELNERYPDLLSRPWWK